jgi:hypothetical protein
VAREFKDLSGGMAAALGLFVKPTRRIIMSNKNPASELPTLDLSQLSQAAGGNGDGGGEGASMADMGMQVVDGGDQVNLLRPIRHIRAMDI